MSIRILLVDDNEVFRRPLQRALEAAGFEVVAVSSAEEALDVLGGSTVDVLLTDHRLPGMDGVELLARVKGAHPALASIVMTAYGTAESAAEASRCGASDYLEKPFEVPDLLRALHRALNQHKLPARGRDVDKPTQHRGEMYGR
jgi:DNA-binding NtrC family response regulator